MMDKVNFKSMENGTAEEYAFLNGLEDQFNVDLPKRLIASLGLSIQVFQVIKLVD